MTLRDLNIKEQYRSDKDDLLSDFYYPCLKCSDSYDRAVGFFTSSGLAHAARGLIGLISRGGRMKLVASPRFTEEDITSINEGYSLREIASRAIVRELEGLSEDALVERVSNLAWLVSRGLLEIKVAVVSSRASSGIYHEKVGIFRSGDDIVAFSGSPNETEGGLVSNFECVDVYTSWSDPKRVQLKVQGFEHLWTNNTANLEVIDFPEAARGQLLRYAPSGKPIGEPGLLPDETGWYSSHGMRLYDFQDEAIRRWALAGHRGILEMATGTGKTFTALCGLASLVNDGYTTLVVVPRKVLATQWEHQIRRHYPQALILVCTGDYNWRSDLQHFTDLASQRSAKPSSFPPIFFISTFHTASSDALLHRLKAESLSARLAVVVDEVHWSGANTFSRILQLDASVRLGLSATPQRHFDAEGTRLILDYFGEKPVFTFDLRDAIRAGFLTEYEYHVREVNLDPTEYQDYVRLSRDIAREFARSGYDEDDPSVHLVALLAERANIVKSAVEKTMFLSYVHANYRPRHCLVYCANLKHLKATARQLSGLGGLVGQFHSKMNEDERSKNLKMFEEGYLDYLVSIKCLDEGVDIPDCTSAIILSSCTNSREFIQRRGRILRKAPNKTRAHIFDPIVVPSSEMTETVFDSSAKKILASELERVEEFGLNAINAEQVVGLTKLLKARYGIL